MLMEKFGDLGWLSKVLKPEFQPFPTVTNREFWDKVPREVRNVYRMRAEEFSQFEWKTLPLSVYLQFYRDGNRSIYESQYFLRRNALSVLVLAECLCGQGRFVDAINDLVWCICEESAWCIPAHNRKGAQGIPDVQLPYVDLFAAETAALLAGVSLLMEPLWQEEYSLLPKRIKYEIDRQVLDSFLAFDDYHWMGFNTRVVNNWTPWINSNCLFVFLTLEKDLERRLYGVRKCMASIDVFIDTNPADGGCDEGPSYWNVAGGALFDALELFYEATDGQVNVFDEPLIRNIGAYIYKVHVKDDYFLNFADAPANLQPSSPLIRKFGQRIHDPLMVQFADASEKRNGRLMPRPRDAAAKLFRLLYDFIWEQERAEKQHGDTYPYIRDAWLPDIQVAVARKREGSCAGLFFAAKGGHNAESHNHNDIGHFVLASDGAPVLIDIGVETYCQKTFSPQRYEIWTMQSQYHNLPTVNGRGQKDGREYCADDVFYRCTDEGVEFSCNIAKAYPPESLISHWTREYLFSRTRDCLRVQEKFSLAAVTQDIVLSFITCCLCMVRDGSIIFRVKDGADVEMRFDAQQMRAELESIPVEDRQLRDVWGSQLYRVLLKAKRAMKEGSIDYDFQCLPPSVSA